MKGKRAWMAALCLCLMAGCGGEGEEPEGTPESTPVIAPLSASTPEPVPTPSPKPELPQEALALLELEEGDVVKDWAAGDLNGDGIEDWAVIVGGPWGEDSDGYDTAGLRSIFIILGDGEGGYLLGQNNGSFIRRADQGGIFGDPYMGIFIEEGKLYYQDYGGSAWRWGNEYTFSWQGEGLALTGWESISTYGPQGIHEEYDLAEGRYKQRVYGGDYDGKLLWEQTFDPPVLRLEDLPDVWEWEGIPIDLPPLPSLGWYKFETMAARYVSPSRTPEAILDKAREEHHPEMYRVDIPWTEETRTNYSTVVGYPVAGYYYTDGEGVLTYDGIVLDWESFEPDFHQIYYQGEAWERYCYSDKTGEEEDRGPEGMTGRIGE